MTGGEIWTPKFLILQSLDLRQPGYHHQAIPLHPKVEIYEHSCITDY